MKHMAASAPAWAHVDPNAVPRIVTDMIPGPKSQALNARGMQYMVGYSSQVTLFPVVFEKGHGVTLTDVDGNVYIDFSSGIYVTTLGHCHPKVSEAVAFHAKNLIVMISIRRSRWLCWRRWLRFSPGT